MSTSSRFIPVKDVPFWAGGEVIRDTIHFKSWVGYRVTNYAGAKSTVLVTADDGSEVWKIACTTVSFATRGLKANGIKVVD